MYNSCKSIYDIYDGNDDECLCGFLMPLLPHRITCCRCCNEQNENESDNESENESEHDSESENECENGIEDGGGDHE